MSNLISILNANSGLITAIATVVLVIITGVYAWLTHKTVEQSKNTERTAFIERRLEKFYYPLLSCLSSPSEINEYFDQIENIFKYSYLATNETKKDFSLYRINKVFPKNGNKEGKVIYDRLYDLVLSDINRFEKDLRNLVK